MLRIALVEDNPADAQMLHTAFAQAGRPVEITLLEDGLLAIAYLIKSDIPPTPRQCDIVLLDLNIPKLNGFEVLERIKACEALKSLPVIVMSGSSDPGEIDRCYRAGANSYICKPTHLDQILATAAQFVDYWSSCVKLPPRRPIAKPSIATQ